MGLQLFPSRVPIGFVMVGGNSVPVMMSPEFYRALNATTQTVTGEENTFTDVYQSFWADAEGKATEPEAMQFAQVVQDALPEWFSAGQSQDSSLEYIQSAGTQPFVPEVFSPVSDRSMSPVETPSVGASPYTYTAGRDGYLTVRGGTVSKIEYVRSGTATDTGVTAGMFPILVGDGLTVTYTVAPTVKFIPR